MNGAAMVIVFRSGSTNSGPASRKVLMIENR